MVKTEEWVFSSPAFYHPEAGDFLFLRHLSLSSTSIDQTNTGPSEETEFNSALFRTSSRFRGAEDAWTPVMAAISPRSVISTVGRPRKSSTLAPASIPSGLRRRSGALFDNRFVRSRPILIRSRSEERRVGKEC